MTQQQFFIVSVFLVFILSISGMLYGQRAIDLDQLWGDMRVLGDNASDGVGAAVAHGDINGDGFMDLIIGAPWADPGGGLTYSGEAYVIFSSSNPPSTIDLSAESADITVYGDTTYNWGAMGISVASGDINGDGYDDIIIGAPKANPGGRTYAGETYVIFGSSNPPSTVDLSTQSADITILGDRISDQPDWSGCSVASGDVNGDGLDDVIIGARQKGPFLVPGTEVGRTYVIFGFNVPWAVTIDLSTQTADITIYGEDALDFFGAAVTSGDVSGDGYDDIIIGAFFADTPGGTDAGKTYVIYGSSSPDSEIDLSTESADITVCGAATEDYSGMTVASGDVNGDGYDDVFISAPQADPGGRTEAGETYIIFGFSTPWPITIDLSTQSADITVCGDAAEDFSGYGLASGDVNGDGYADIIIGAYGADPGGRSNAGKTYVILSTSLPSATIDLSTQSADICIYGDDADDGSGSAVASGDLNSDGYDDLIIGASNASPGGRYRAGETNLILGGGSIITAHGLGGKSWIKEFSLLANGWNSFKAFGGVNSQGEVHLAVGDIDADKLDEIAAGQGEGAKSWVKFFEVDGSLISTFKAFGASNTNGELHLAIGNFDADTSDNEIAIAQGEGGQSWVKTFETDGTPITAFKAFGAANAQGEVHLAAADLENADGIDEIIAGMGEGGSSRVKIFNYDGTIVRSFQAFETADNPGGEVRLAVVNFDADADLEIAASTGYNGGNKVRLFEKDGTLIKQFLAFGFGGNTNGDVQITASDIDNDGVDEIICAHGEGGSSVVKVFKADGTFIRSFKAFGGVNAQGEVHLGRSNY